MLKRLKMLLFLVLIAHWVAPVSAAEPVYKVRNWVNLHLREALVPGADMNRVSSLVTPLSSDVQRNGNAQSRQTLLQVAGFLERQDTADWGCGKLADLYLTAGMLQKAGIALDIGDADQRLAGCELGNSEFDLANSLLFACRYSDWNHAERLPGGLARLEKAQAGDGQFVTANGRRNYYLTSHALLAVYYCAGDERVIARGQRYLQSVLPRFAQVGFYDGLAESLIFLRWMGQPVVGFERYRDYLLQAVQPDGGICFTQKPGCKPHWHAVSLLMELLLMSEST